MIQSSHQIDFITPAGTWRLLNYGDILDAEIQPVTVQEVSSHAGIGAAWGSTAAQGAALTDLDWVRREQHASHAALRAAVLRTAATFPANQSGTLKLSIQGGEVWEIQNCTLLASRPQPAIGGVFATMTAWTARGGQMLPAAAIPLYSGIPWAFILQGWASISSNWETY